MIQGHFFNSETSEKKDVSLTYYADGLVRFNSIKTGDLYFNDLKISSRIANTPRYITLPDGSQFESMDNQAIDEMVKQFSESFINGLAHKLENAKSFILLTVVGVIIFAWLFIQLGVPFFSKQVAHLLPEQASQYMGQGVLEVMDKSWFDKSQLSEKKQSELRQLFKDLQKNIAGSENYKLVFRLGGKIQANAFALPDGTIVFTDELINLAENNLEIASIMLHEMGHLKHRHSLRSTIQQFSLAMFMMAVTGDVSTSSSIVSAIPLMLIESGYSQGMETEADTFSLNYMKEHSINPNYFAVIMEKLQASYLPEYSECKETSKGFEGNIKCIKEAVLKNKNNKKREELLNYFSTHPSSNERIERFKISQ